LVIGNRSWNGVSVARCVVMGERKGITGRKSVDVTKGEIQGILLVIIEDSAGEIPR